jgi:hypothetical protein
MIIQCCTSLLLLLAAGTAFAAPPQAAEADFAQASARVDTPARAGADRALRDFAAQWQAEAGTLPQGFPFDVAEVADLAGAKVGYGFRVYEADPATLLAGSSLDASLRATGTWRFNVTLDGRPIGLMTLAEDADGWQAVSFGGAGLAKEIDAVVDARAGQALRYVRVNAATSDFIAVGDGGKARYAPLRAARESLRLAAVGKHGGDGLYADAELAAQLRDGVGRGLAGQQGE